jgi:hypothetical protein
MRQEHPIILKPITLGDLWRTRLYMELSPGMRCIGRSPEAVLAEHEEVLRYQASGWRELDGRVVTTWPKDDLPEAGHGHVANAEGAEQDEHEEQDDDHPDDDLDGRGHGDVLLDEIQGNAADDEDEE